MRHPLRGLLIGPLAYAATLVWGAPVLFALRRFGRLNAATLIATGALGGALAAAAGWLAGMGANGTRS